jgi:hypothetical protein
LNSRQADEVGAAEFQEAEDTAWVVFNALCQKVNHLALEVPRLKTYTQVLMSANGVLHSAFILFPLIRSLLTVYPDEKIDRDPVNLDDALHRSSISENSAPSFGLASSQNIHEEVVVAPRREFVWRFMDRGQQCLATIARRMALDLDMNLSPLHRLTRSDGRNPHRCRGYIREEITLATTTLDSAVVAHDTPSPMEICSICHEVVGFDEGFRCICGDPSEFDLVNV